MELMPMNNTCQEKIQTSVRFGRGFFYEFSLADVIYLIQCTRRHGGCIFAASRITDIWSLKQNITMTPLWGQWRLKSPASRLFTRPFFSGTDQRKHQSSASLTFVVRIDSPYKMPVTQKIFPFNDVIMWSLKTYTALLTIIYEVKHMCNRGTICRFIAVELYCDHTLPLVNRLAPVSDHSNAGPCLKRILIDHQGNLSWLCRQWHFKGNWSCLSTDIAVVLIHYVSCGSCGMRW